MLDNPDDKYVLLEGPSRAASPSSGCAPVILLIVGGIAAYGFWDSHAAFDYHGDFGLTGKVVTDESVAWDTLDHFAKAGAIRRGDLFLKLEWNQPTGATIKDIEVSGGVWDANTLIETFKDKCLRVDSTDLARPPNIAADGGPARAHPECFVRLHKSVSDLPGYKERQGNDLFDAGPSRVELLDLRDITYRARAARKPLRWVKWTENWISARWQAISYAFSREE